MGSLLFRIMSQKHRKVQVTVTNLIELIAIELSHQSQ